MDFSIPLPLAEEVERAERVAAETVLPHLHTWTREGSIPREFFARLGSAGESDSPPTVTGSAPTGTSCSPRPRIAAGVATDG